MGVGTTGAVTGREAARYLGVCERTVYALRKAGKLKCFRVGSAVRYRVEALEQYMAAAEAESEGGAE